MAKFKKGQSGNPAGKKPGTVNRQLAALRAAADKVLPLVVKKAITGDFDAQKLILDRALPRLKPMTPAEPFTLPGEGLQAQIQAILQQMADGELSPTAAAEVAAVIAAAARVEGGEREAERTQEILSHMEAVVDVIKATVPERDIGDMENG